MINELPTTSRKRPIFVSDPQPLLVMARGNNKPKHSNPSTQSKLDIPKNLSLILPPHIQSPFLTSEIAKIDDKFFSQLKTNDESQIPRQWNCTLRDQTLDTCDWIQETNTTVLDEVNESSLNHAFISGEETRMYDNVDRLATSYDVSFLTKESHGKLLSKPSTR